MAAAIAGSAGGKRDDLLTPFFLVHRALPGKADLYSSDIVPVPNIKCWREPGAERLANQLRTKANSDYCAIGGNAPGDQ